MASLPRKAGDVAALIRELAPTEPGWYLVRMVDVGDVEEWGPRLAGEHTLAEMLEALATAARLDKIDEQALALVAQRKVLPSPHVAEWQDRARRCAGLLEVQRAGQTVVCELTQRGHLVLAVAAALRRARMA